MATAERAHDPETPRGLSDRDLLLLDFERRGWRRAAAKDDAIRDQLGLSVARYYQLLNLVIDSPEALRYDPILVGRLLRARDARTRARLARSFTPDSGRASDVP